MIRTPATVAANIMSAILSAFALCAVAVYVIADHSIDLRMDWEKFQRAFNGLWPFVLLSSFCAALLAAMGFERALPRSKVGLYAFGIVGMVLASTIGQGLIDFYYVLALIVISFFPYALFLLTGFFLKIKHARYYALTYSIALIFAHVFFTLPCMQASARSNISKAKNDMRSIATALEAYFVDYSAYPPSTTDLGKQISFTAKSSVPTFHGYTPGGHASLTTPVAYMSELPNDPFSEYRRLRGSVHEISIFAYWAPPGANGWILLSPGPDYIFNIDFPTLKRVYRPKEANPTADLLLLTYDATNGTQSRGDLWRVKQ